MNDYTLPEGCALILRTCIADMTSHGGFRWPESGPVECPDWDPEPECGSGLHGLLWGAGNGSLLNWVPDATWIVAEVEIAHIVDLGGKVKCPRASVIYAGDRGTAINLITRHAPPGTAIVGHTASAGDYGTATAGNRGTASAGDRGTASAGDCGTATAGYRGTATAGYRGTASAGECGTATACDYGSATVGEYGTASAGDWGSASAGDYGTATAGYRGTATAGYRGTASAGECGTASAGEYGVITIRYFNERSRVRVGCVGEDGLLPGVKYRLDDNGNFVRAEDGK